MFELEHSLAVLAVDYKNVIYLFSKYFKISTGPLVLYHRGTIYTNVFSRVL